MKRIPDFRVSAGISNWSQSINVWLSCLSLYRCTWQSDLLWNNTAFINYPCPCVAVVEYFDSLGGGRAEVPCSCVAESYGVTVPALAGAHVAPLWTSPRSSLSPARQSSDCWAGSKATKKRSGQRRRWMRWSRSWRRKRVLWRSWRGLSAAPVSQATVSLSPARWMEGSRCHTGKGCLTSSTAAYGVGPTCSHIMSSRPWSVASSLLELSRKMCASIPTTTRGWTVQVSD